MTKAMRQPPTNAKQAFRQTLLAWVPDESAAAKVKTVVEGIANLACEVVIGDSPFAAATPHSVTGADIGLIQLPELNEKILKQVEQLARTWRNGSCLIAMLRDPSADRMRRLSRAGIVDVLPLSCSEAELGRALTQASASVGATGERRREGRVITILKSAGGCGASMIAANLASEFHHQTGQRVALVDLDIQFGSLALYLDMRPRHSLLEALQAGARLDETLLDTLMEKHSSGVELLAAPRHMVPLDRVGEEFISILIRLLKNIYPVSVIELPAGWGDWFGAVFGRSDLLALVCEPTVRNAAGLNRVMQSLDDLSISNVPLCVIANKVRRNSDTRHWIEQLRSTQHGPIEIIRYDGDAAECAADAGMLLYKIAPKSGCYKDLRALAVRMLTQIDRRLATPEPRENPWFKNLLSGRWA